MDKNERKALLLLIMVVILLWGYFYLTNWIETNKIYKYEPQSFDFSIWMHTKNLSCIDFHDTSIAYYNDPKWFESDFQLKLPENSKNVVTLFITAFRHCPLNDSYLELTISNFSGGISKIRYYNENLTSISRENETVKIHFLNSTYLGSQTLYLGFSIDKDFYNYYRITSESLDNYNININMFDFSFKNNICEGLVADESSFIIYGPNFRSDPLRYGISKRFYFTNTSQFTLYFNAKPKIWFLIQKILDALVLGVIAGIICSFPWFKLKSIIKKLYKSIKLFLFMQKRTTLNIIYWIILIIFLILFFILSGIPRIFLGFLMFVLLIYYASITINSWSHKFWEDIGIALIGGLIVSLFKDVATNNFNNQIIPMYIMGFVTGIVLLFMGVVGLQENKKSKNS